MANQSYNTLRNGSSMAGRKVWGILFAVVVCSILFISCKGKQKTDDLNFLPRSKTLYMSGFLWGPPSTFNPLSDDPAFPNTGDCNLVYESMFGYNSLTGELEGILGKEYMLEEDFLTVILNENAKWHNGEPVTSEDVMYTFGIHKKYDTPLHSHWEYIAEMEVEGAHTVVFTISKDKYNPLTMKDIIASTYILPKKIFKELEEKAIAEVKAAGADTVEPEPDDVFEKICEFKNDKAVGSGPYTIYSYSDKKVILKRFDDYWGNIMHGGQKPPPVYIVHQIFKSNDAGNLALIQGQIDMSQNFIPQIWNKFDKGIGTWYKEKPYYIPGTIPCMLIGLIKSPFNNVKFRQAVAHAVNYTQILDLSIYGYAPTLKPGLIMPYGSEKQYYNEEDVDKYGVSYNPEKAKNILKDAGYALGEDGMLIDPDGKKIKTIYATCPSGWTDWESAIRIFVTGLRAVGIDVREKFIEYPVWWKELINGNFDFTMYTPQDFQTASLPWARFQAIMSSDEWAPLGEPMWNNQGRYKDPVADSLLNVLPKLTDDEEIKKTYRVLNIKFMKEMPVIPLMYRPWFFYEFSTKHWTNFPTSENPYSPPQCLIVGAGIKALWNIKPAGK